MVQKIKKIGKYVVSSLVVAQATVSTAFAQSASDYLSGINSASAGGGDLLGFVRSALNLAIGLAGLIAVGFLVYSGIQYILAAGDEGKVEKATKGITYSIIGLIICFISVLIVNFVLERVLGAA